MGLGSIGIYSHELFKDYGVECIVRVGTAGSYSSSLGVGEIVLARESFSFSTEFNRLLLGDEAARSINKPSDRLNDLILKTASRLGIDVKERRFHSTEVFYTKSKDPLTLRQESGADLVEMESYALFATAEALGRQAACICTISDNIVTGEVMPAAKRERGLEDLFKLALESAYQLSLGLKG